MKKRLIIISCLGIIGIIVAINLITHYDRIKLDGYFCEISSLIIPPDTKYSDGYSHKKFREIEIGMTEKQVINVIGMPHTIWRPYKLTKFNEKQHFIGFQYSTSPSSADYRLRQVYFDNGIVAEIISEYYYD